MEVHLNSMTASVFILWFALAFSICRGDVADIATEDFFNGLLSRASDTCVGKNFYRYIGFITAANTFSGFGTTGSSDDQKREIVAFLANVEHETGSLCYIEEINKSDYCDSSYTQYPCAYGKQYYGRGPIQLSCWRLPGHLLNSPELVAPNDEIAWKTTLWYWNVDSDCHSAITSGEGYRATIQAINGAIECSGGNTDQVNTASVITQ